MSKGKKLNNGRYVIEEELGDGSEGIVYLVKDTEQFHVL